MAARMRCRERLLQHRRSGKNSSPFVAASSWRVQGGAPAARSPCAGRMIVAAVQAGRSLISHVYRTNADRPIAGAALPGRPARAWLEGLSDRRDCIAAPAPEPTGLAAARGAHPVTGVTRVAHRSRAQDHPRLSSLDPGMQRQSVLRRGRNASRRRPACWTIWSLTDVALHDFSEGSGGPAVRVPGPPTVDHSGTASPDPPNSLGKSFSFGKPSRIGSTVSE